jgi:hypothetical protein
VRRSRKDVAATRAFDATDAVAAVASAGLIAGVLLSWPLWASSRRLYPRAPIFAGVRVPASIEWALATALLLALLCAAVRLVPRVAMTSALAIGAVLVALDQSRLQPWVYEYGLLLAVLRARGPGIAAGDRPAVLDTCRLIVVALYGWSAVQKMNVTFVTRTWRDVCAGLGPPFSDHLGGLGWLIPLVELAIATGLLVPRLRRAAVVTAVATHATIVALLVATRENSVVWPWNVALALLVVLLFRDTTSTAAHIVRGDGTIRHRTLVIVAGVVPILSFAGLWDAYLAGALYSGNTIQAVVIVPPEIVSQLPAVVGDNTWRESPPYFVDLNRWSYAELNVPLYPADRVVTAIGRDVCRRWIPAGEPATLRILGRPDWRTGVRIQASESCEELDAPP